MALREINFDGIIGPSHNYAGLSFGNLASTRNAGQVSQPRAAALQGLDKMRANLALGLAQGIFVPLGRPNRDWLAALGTTFEECEPTLAAAAKFQAFYHSLCPPLPKKTVRVIPTETVPQGIAALIAFLPEADYETNVREMTEAVKTVRTLEITRATRASRSNGLDIVAGACIGLLDNELLASAATCEEVAFKLLGRLDTGNAEILTLYYGQNTAAEAAEAFGNEITERYPDLEVGVVDGGQPNYDYLISVE